MRYLTVALTKGRLANKTMEMFEKAGITCEEMKDKDSRKLIFVNEELKLRFFLAKGPDVPTYVEYGAADIGIVGKDTILEEGRKLYEVMDLGFGACRMCVCGPESAKPLLNSNQLIRVATKYPNIAKDYFPIQILLERYKVLLMSFWLFLFTFIIVRKNQTVLTTKYTMKLLQEVTIVFQIPQQELG